MQKVFVMLLLAAAGAFATDTLSVAVVPEPATFAVMGAGLAGVAYLGWKRNRKK